MVTLRPKAVFGIGFGDEGKGVVVDYLTKKIENPLVIRFSGGQQAGHTVIIGDKKHVFSNFCSGTLRGAPSYLSKFMTIDPVGILNELEYIRKLDIEPLIYIDSESPITTPYDIHHNQNFMRDIVNGTCGLGVGSTINREENFYSFTFEDLYNPNIIDIKMENIKHFYKIDDIEYLYLNEKIYSFLKACSQLIREPNVKLTYGIPSDYNLIFEGSQGLLLDQYYGFFPHVARTNTGTKNVNELIGDNFEIYLVTRAYQNRHGNGPMTNEHIDHNIKKNPDETNVSNKYQGDFRISYLDVSLLEYGINKDRIIRENVNKNIVITCLDHMDEYVFTYKGEMIICKNEKEFVKKIGEILKIKNIYINRTPESNLEKI